MAKQTSTDDAAGSIPVQTRLTEDEVRLLDEARRAEPDLPSRAQMIRRVLGKHLKKIADKAR
ncbi:MAG: hypothetical protein AB7O57_02900 [Hyphomicrobiaceae bacterium]